MRIEIREAGFSLLRFFAAAILLLATLESPVFAQVEFDAATEVADFHFRWTDTQTLEESELRPLLVTKARGGAHGLRETLGKLPLIPSPAPLPGTCRSRSCRSKTEIGTPRAANIV